MMSPQTKVKNIEDQKVLELESVSINKSLTTLGRIFKLLIDQKTQGNVSIPYRDSKLTRILQSSLSPSSKVLMIVNICSELNHLNQTREALKFAKQAMLAY